MAELYRQKVTDLAQALQRSDTRLEASEAIRGVIHAIVLTPSQGALQIELRGNLAAMLSAAQNAKRSPEGDLSLQIGWLRGRVAVIGDGCLGGCGMTDQTHCCAALRRNF